MLFKTSLISTIVLLIVFILDEKRDGDVNFILLLAFVLVLATTIRDYIKYMR
ncbi:MAG: hypothetical protein Q4B36_05465 [Tissierellia bacterium]|nr:hypothetical protein [Tissierellia bacterium]